MKNLCIIPWVHVNVETSGDIFPCCAYEGNPIGNINQDSIEDIWNSVDYKNFRSEMLSGNWPKGCKGCYKVEELGGQSKRQRENYLRSHLFHLVENDSPNFNLKYVDLRFSNVCNFKCRYCNPLASHSIAAEYRQIGLTSLESNILKFDKKNIIDSLYKNIENLEEVYFCGGEPLLMDEHYEFLERLIEANNTDLVLRYSTNLSKLKYKNNDIINWWKYFSNVSVHASIDHYGKKLEYIRSGSNWNNTVNNLKTIHENNIELRIAGTVSIFNVLDLPEIFETFNNLEILNYEQIGMANVVKNPSYYDIQSLNPLIKKEVERKLLSYAPNNEMIETMCKYVVAYMNERNTWEENREEFSRMTKILDLSRGENFLEIFPELRKQIEW